MKRDRSLVIRNVGKVFAERVRGLQFSLRLQPQQRGGGELLGERGDVVNGLRGIRSLRVGEAISFVQQDVIALCDQNRAGKAVGREPREVLIDAGRNFAGNNYVARRSRLAAGPREYGANESPKQECRCEGFFDRMFHVASLIGASVGVAGLLVNALANEGLG